MNNPFRSAQEYATELLRIRDKRGKIIPFKPNFVQRFIRTKKKEAVRAGKPWRFLIPKARRMGVTTQEQADSFSLCATKDGIRAATLAATREQTQTIFGMANLFFDELPGEFRPTRDHENKQALKFRVPRSSFFIGTAGATSAFRGDTLQRVHGSEVAFWLPGKPSSKVDNLVAGLTEAATHGEVTLESTSNGDTGWWADTVLEAARGENEYTVIFVPWWKDPTYRKAVSRDERYAILDSLEEREEWLIQHHGLSVEQIAWRRAKKSEKAMKKLFLQEYPEVLEESFLSSEECYFDTETLDYLNANLIEPRGEQDGVGIWEDPIKGQQYVIGADVAEGVAGGDFSSGYVLNKRTGDTVARIHRRCRPEALAEQLAKLGRHYNGALVGPERNNHGHLTVHELRTHLGYPNVYYERSMAIQGKQGMRKKANITWGWDTSAITRPILLDDLKQAVSGGWNPKCSKFLAEARRFEDNGKGKFEAKSGAHDDCVMALGIALQVRSRAPEGPGIS